MKKILSYLMVICMLVSFVGCNSKVNTNNKKFVEEELNLPELERIFNFRLLENNILDLIGLDVQGNIKEYISEDLGQTWKENENEILSLLEEKEVYDIEQNKSEAIIALYSDNKDSEETELKNLLLRKDALPLNIDISNEKISTLIKNEILFNADILCWFDGNKIVQYDKDSGKIKSSYNIESNEIMDVKSISNNLMILTSKGLIQYDLNTGKEVEKIKELNNYIDGNTKLYSGNEADEMYFVNSKGLYKYNIKNKEIEQIIDSKTNLLSNREKVIIGFEKIDNKNFLMLYSGYNSLTLCRYSYLEEANNDEMKELKVYSLYENELIKQSISLYERKNKGIKIDYKVGIEEQEENNTTKSDALKVLNAEIMAGNGPDIMILDNISSASYLEKDMFEDIKDIIDNKKDSLFKGIVQAYEKDNSIYTLPLRVKLPVIMGEKEHINNINDLSSLTDVVEKDLSAESKVIFSIFNPQDIITLIYYTSSEKLIGDKMLNKEEMEIFLEKTKKIYSISQSNVSEEHLEVYKKLEDEFTKTQKKSKYELSKNLYLENSIDGIGFLYENAMIEIGYIESFNKLAEISTVTKEKPTLFYKPWSGNGKNMFHPKEIVAISSKGKNKDIAREFLSSLLDESYQEIYEDDGLPININSFSNLYKKNLGNSNLGAFAFEDNGENKEFSIVWPTEEEFKTILEYMNNADTKTNLNTDILEPIMKASEDYSLNNCTLDEAVEYISNELEIYLSE